MQTHRHREPRTLRHTEMSREEAKPALRPGSGRSQSPRSATGSHYLPSSHTTPRPAQKHSTPLPLSRCCSSLPPPSTPGGLPNCAPKHLLLRLPAAAEAQATRPRATRPMRAATPWLAFARRTSLQVAQNPKRKPCCGSFAKGFQEVSERERERASTTRNRD
jgi:hypothetical protein